MTSLLLHISLGLAVAHLIRTEKKSILLLGSILPDIKIVPYLLITPVFGLTYANLFIIPIHSVSGAMLLSAFLSSLRRKEEFMPTLKLLGAGVLAHFAIDASMFPYAGIEHYLLLYPVSWEPVGLSTGPLLDYLSVLALFFFASFFAYRFVNRKNGGMDI